jgi:hypothetical protein
VLVINLDIGDVVLENGRDVDLSGDTVSLCFDFFCDPGREMVSELGVIEDG